jgi:hypothetical protein
MTTARALAMAALAVVMTAAPVVADRGVEAETLFREGKRLLKQGDTSGACDKFEASERLEPTAGTELNLADCRERMGEIATAWATFLKAAATAKHSDTDGKREAEARRRAAALEPKLVHLRIIVAPDHPDGMIVKRNGAVVDQELWNQRVPVDPGDYAITVDAPGYAQWRTDLAVKDKDKKIEIPTLDKDVAETGVATHRPKPTPSDDESGAVVARSPSPGMTTRRKLGIVLTGVGAGALIGAVALAAIANGAEDQANMLCPGTFCTDQHAIQLNTEARNDAPYGNVGFALAGVLVVTGAVLWITGGHKAPVAVSITSSATGGSFVIGGAW